MHITVVVSRVVSCKDKRSSLVVVEDAADADVVDVDADGVAAVDVVDSVVCCWCLLCAVAVDVAVDAVADDVCQ